MTKPSKSARSASGKAARRPRTAKGAKPANRNKRGSSATASVGEGGSVRAGTKTARLIALLRRKDGATIADLIEVTGWQAHSVRGALSGTLKKKLGLAVASDKVDGRGRVYSIIEHG